MKKYILWFEEIDKNDTAIVGGKGANLGEMINSDFPVPYGFVLTAQAYFYVIYENNLEREIKHYLSVINFENPKELHDGSEAIRRLILSAHIPKDLLSDIHHYYAHLGSNEAKIYRKGTLHQVVKHVVSTYKAPVVAVRSSATAEDLPEASFAGQQETFLNVFGEHQLVQKVKECWASLFTERAMYYRYQKKFDHLKVGLAAVVQRMIESEKSGIAFSIDPVTNNRKTITIEAIYGLGEYIVGGTVTPDHYEVAKDTFSILKKEIKLQKVKLVKDSKGNKEVVLTKSIGEHQKLDDSQIVELAKVVKSIEDHYGFPQDIEWSFEKGKIYIVQSRPITTMKVKNVTAEASEAKVSSQKVLVKGAPASPGIGIGAPVIILSPNEIYKIQKGDVLVAPMTDPDYVPAMKKASAIVTELGGRTSHAAIVSRELGIPAIVGADGATKILKDHKEITVNGTSGEAYKGRLEIFESKEKKKPLTKSSMKTLTKIYLNLAQVDEAQKRSELNVDGVGLLRAEFMMADIGIHPKKIIKDGKQEYFIKKLTQNLLKVVKPFSPRPVVYRATDFKTNEYRNLKGGADYEPHEENPMIGFRGASRYVVWKDVFDMELEAVKRVREQGYTNLHLMIPFIRIPIELVQIKSIIREHGLDLHPSFKLWIMVEVPSTVLLLEDFIKIGIDGVSIGTNDLTMLILGVDRDNHEVSYIYSELNPAVEWALEKIVTTCRKHGVTVSVCGQAPSDYPDLAEKLVRWGATSLSLNADAIDRTRLLIHNVEKHLWHELKK